MKTWVSYPTDNPQGKPNNLRHPGRIANMIEAATVPCFRPEERRIQRVAGGNYFNKAPVVYQELKGTEWRTLVGTLGRFFLRQQHFLFPLGSRTDEFRFRAYRIDDF